MTKKVKDVADVLRTFEVDGVNYEEIDKEAEVGDLIAVTSRNNNKVGSYYDVGHVGRVKSVDGRGDPHVDFNDFGNGFVDGDGCWFVGGANEGGYTVVEKTRPGTLTEMPKVGDKIRYVGDDFDDLEYGTVYEIEGIGEYGVAYFNNGRGRRWYVISDDYFDKRNFDQFELVAEETESLSPQTDRDLIVELSQTVAKLKREAELNDDFIAETLTRIDDAIERLTDDVCMIDERTQPLVEDGISDFAKELADMIGRKINDSRAEGRI